MSVGNRKHINLSITLRILAFVALGFDVADALDAVLGKGTFASLAGDVWESLRANA